MLRLSSTPPRPVPYAPHSHSPSKAADQDASPSPLRPSNASAYSLPSLPLPHANGQTHQGPGPRKPTHQRQPRHPSSSNLPAMSFAPPHLSSPPTSTPPTPSDRLETLITQIQGVLRAYTALPVQNPIHLASLKEFLRKAVELDPEHMGYGYTASPSSDGHEPLASFRSRQCGSAVNVRGEDAGIEESPSADAEGIKVQDSDVSGEEESQREPDLIAVLKLENAWWASEVVAAWYGPRPGCRAPSERAKARKGSEREAITRRFASLIALDDD